MKNVLKSFTLLVNSANKKYVIFLSATKQEEMEKAYIMS